MKTRNQFYTLLRGLILIAATATGYFPIESQAASPQIFVAVRDSMDKWSRNQILTADISPKILLAGARNEAETIQILLSAPSGASNVSASLTPLVGPKGSNPKNIQLKLMLVAYAKITQPSHDKDIPGAWPDGLIPLANKFNIPAKNQQSIWLKAIIDRNAKTGIYRATLVLKQNATIFAKIPLTVTVWNIDLPDQVHMPIVAGIDYDSIKKFDGAGLSESQFENDVLVRYYKTLSENRVFPLNIYNGVPNYRLENGQSEIDFAPYAQRIGMAYYRPNAPIMIPFFEDWPVDTEKYPLFSDEYNQIAIDYLRKVALFFEKNGTLDQSYIYLPSIDEPSTNDQYSLVDQFSLLLKVADPRLKLLLTITSECPACVKPFNDLDNTNILWAPNLAFVDNKALKLTRSLLGIVQSVSEVPSGWNRNFEQQLSASGRQTWWYLNPWTFVTRDSKYKYPNLYVDHPGIEHRIIGWMAYKFGVTTVGFWNATYWQYISNPWLQVPMGEEGSSLAGDGSLLYPATIPAGLSSQPQPSQPVTSIRLELLREASEDYEYLYLLSQKGRGLAATNFATLAAPSLTTYQSQSAQLQKLRIQVANSIMGK